MPRGRAAIAVDFKGEGAMHPSDPAVSAATPRMAVISAAQSHFRGKSLMNIVRAVNSVQTWTRRLTAFGACVALTACGQSQNWSPNPAFVSIGGTVSGLTGTLSLSDNGVDPLTVKTNGPFTFALSIASGSTYSVTIKAQPAGQTCTLTNASGTTTSPVTNIAISCANTPTIGGTVAGLLGTMVLQDNGGDNLNVTANGPFTFATPVANGAAYAVTVASQPAGETCAVTNGSGKATANVTTVVVDCSTFTLRPLPAVYTSGKAVNYSPYRAGGPNAGEVPSDADIIQDLQLLQQGGFRLLRLFGADAVAAKILNLANINTPTLRFQVGIYLEGAPASCVDSVNSAQMAEGVTLANTYPNVVAVSVGNETSFAGNLPIACLTSYVQSVRSQVMQPVTADDDYTFYEGADAGRNYAPDTVLRTIDFASIHIYPFSNTGAWDWQQTGVAAGPARATAMMNAALAEAKTAYAAVANYAYKNAAGTTTTIGASLPITIGETGWKAVPTNPGSAIEQVTNPAIANPVNAKMYYDLLGGWTGAGAPVSIVYFEAFDEAWKGQDDGWGLWDKTRTARYALCGTAVGPVCGTPIYAGAGYFH